VNFLSMGPRTPISLLFIYIQVSLYGFAILSIHIHVFADYMRSSILKNPNPLTLNMILPAKEPPKVPPGIRNPKTFLEVGRYLHMLLIAEMNHGSNPFLAQWKDKPKAFGRAYQAQFIAYAQGAYPFTTPLTNGQSPLEWWMAFEETEHGGILAVSSISLYIRISMVLIHTSTGHRDKALRGSSTLNG
jgi:hypothetical protein